MQLTVKEICNRIWILEDKYDLLSKDIQGVKPWQLLRMPIYYEIAEKTGVFGEPHTKGNGLLDRMKALPGFLYNSVINNPLIGKYQKRILVFDHPRKRLVDNKYIDVYTYYLLESLPKDETLILEGPYLNKHFSAKEENRQYLDYIKIAAVLMSKLSLINFSKEEAAFIKKLENEIYTLFGVKLNLSIKFLEAIKKYKIEYNLYDKLFRKRQPEKIYLVVSYGHGALIAAAKQNKIPVIEIQHGTMSPYHLGYSFPNCDKELEYFPDYLYSFGDYWTESVKLPIGRDRVISYGYPYFRALKKAYENVVKKPKQLLFLSQGVLGKELSTFAYKAALELTDYNIIYKLHPGEYDRWKEEYKELNLAKDLDNFIIVDNDKINLYQYLAESQVQVGVFSTAIYEGIAFKCKTILIDLPGLEYMKDLLDRGFAKEVRDIEQLKEALKQNITDDIDVNYFFLGI